jgi:hypothetical protein
MAYDQRLADAERERDDWRTAARALADADDELTAAKIEYRKANTQTGTDEYTYTLAQTRYVAAARAMTAALARVRSLERGGSDG